MKKDYFIIFLFIIFISGLTSIYLIDNYIENNFNSNFDTYSNTKLDNNYTNSNNETFNNSDSNINKLENKTNSNSSVRNDEDSDSNDVNINTNKSSKTDKNNTINNSNSNHNPSSKHSNSNNYQNSISNYSDKLYIERYNNGYYIYLPAKSSNKFIRYDFRKIVNNQTKSNGYGLYQIASVSYSNNRFNYNRNITLANTNMECAVKLRDSSVNFMGIIGHGYEITKAMTIELDGTNVTNISKGTIVSGNNIRIKMWNLMYNPDNINANIISRGVNYYINKDSVNLVQTLKFLINTDVKFIYMGMLPVISYDNLGVVTSKVRVNDGPTQNVDNVINLGSIINAKKFEVFSDISGVYATIKLNSSNDSLYCNNSSSFMSRNANVSYNKVYFRYCGNNFNVKVNQELTQSISFIIDLKK